MKKLALLSALLLPFFERIIGEEYEKFKRL